MKNLLKTYIPKTNLQIAQIDASLGSKENHPVIFQSAASLLGLTSGIYVIDSILNGLKEGEHTLLIGDLCQTLVERLCLRAILPRGHGGFCTKSIFIDADNCSDLYLFAFYARRYQINPKEAMQQVITSRAFNIYQLSNLIINELPKILKLYESKLIMLAELPTMFINFQMDICESKRILEAIIKSINRILDEGKYIVISSSKKRNFLVDFLIERVNITLEIQSMESRLATVSLLKHQDKNTSKTIFHQDELLKTIKYPTSKGND
jgi:hypothetical protein